MIAISFAATNFPMENLVEVDALLDFERPEVDEDEQPRRENRSVVQLDRKEFDK